MSQSEQALSQVRTVQSNAQALATVCQQITNNSLALWVECLQFQLQSLSLPHRPEQTLAAALAPAGFCLSAALLSDLSQTAALVS